MELQPEIAQNWAAIFDRIANRITHLTGSSAAFLTACTVVLIWGLTGPLFDYSEDWQLVINTGTTIVTFLMVFVIQKAQNKDALAVQLKLNELIAATKGASNRLVAVENLTDEELAVLCRHYDTMAEVTRQASDLRKSHSVEEAIEEAQQKLTNKPSNQQRLG
ncbi:low affinity iron permease family protein (plasmid) [Fibrella sp. ES10-3-2-2]